MAISAVAGLVSAIGAAAGGLTVFGLAATTLGGFAAAFALGAGLSALSRALTPQPKLGSQLKGITQTTREPAGSRQLIYGQIRVGGQVVFIANSGQTNEYLHLAIAFASHEIESFEEFWLNDKKVYENGAVTSDWSDVVTITKFDGTQTTADSTLTSVSNKWTSNHVLNGIAYAHFRLKWDQDKFPQGVPNISAVIKGKKVYDPRDSNQSATDSSTWTYSQNPALCLRDYFVDSKYGLGEDYTLIDDTALEDAADLCDESVSLSGGGTQNRYKLNGVIDTANQIKDNIEQMLSAMGGRVSYSGGKYFIAGAEYQAPTVSFDEADCVADIQVQTKQSRRSGYNGVKGIFVSEEKDYKVLDYPAQISSTYATEDGDPIYLDMPLPFVTNNFQAQRIAKIALLKSRQQTVLTMTVNLKGLRVKVGDTINVSNTHLGYSSKVFEVIDYSLAISDGALAVNLTCIETASAVYDWDTSDEADFLSGGELDLYDGRTVDNVTNLSMTEIGLRGPDGGVKSAVELSWTAPDDAFIEFYTVRYNKNGTTDYFEVQTRETNALLEGLDISSNYDFRVKAQNLIGVRSSGTSLTNQSLNGDQTAPSAPTSGAATGGIQTITAEWSNPTDIDFKHVEVFVNTTDSIPATPTAVVDGEEYIVTGLSGAATRYFWLKSVDFSGNKSAATASFSGTSVVASSSDIGTGAVGSTQIDTGAVGTTEIADNAVDITKIADTLQSTNYVAATSGWKLTTDGTFEAGDGTFRGTITSTGGTIGGFTLGSQSLTAGSGSNAVGIHTVKGIYLGATTFSSAPFRVNTAGEFTATNATITGSITATSLTLSGTSIAESQLESGVQTSLGLADSALQDGDTSVNLGLDDGSIAGINITSTKLYAGTGTWANSNTGFYLDNTGKFSLKDKFFYNPSNNLLTVDGNITADVITAKENLVVLGDLEASSMAAGSITRAMFSQDALDEIYGALATSVGGSNGDYKEASGNFTTSGGTVTVGTSSDKFDHGTADVEVEFLANHYFYTTTNYTTAQAQATLNFEVSADGTFTDLTSATKTQTLQFLEYDLTSYYGYTYLVYYFNGEHTKTFTTGSGNDIPDSTELQFRVRVTGVGTAFTSQTIPFTVEANEGVTGVVSTGGNADTLDNLDSTKFLRSDVDDTFDANLTITGNLTVQGTQTTLNTATLNVEDKNIVLNYGTGDTSGSANGAGITIQDAVSSSSDASITWNATGDHFQVSHGTTFGVNDLDPDSYTGTAGGFGRIADGGGWVARGLYVHGGATGDAAAIGHNGSRLYFGIQNNSTAGSMATWLDVQPNKQTTFAAQLNVTGHGNSSQWNTAYGWGNHASAGYQSATTFTGNATLSNRSTTAQNTVGDGRGVTFNYSGTSGNKPTGIDHSLMTMAYNNNWQTQFAQDWRNGGRAYIRGQNNGTWSSWSRIWSSDDFANNSANWDTAYGWGDHSTQGYLTSADLSGYLTAESDTLATVTGRGATTNTRLGIGTSASASYDLQIGEHLNISSGHLYVDGTVRINENGNATFNTISSGQITSSGSVTAGNASTSLGFYVGTTQVIQGSTRNLVNIGTISSGAITSSGDVKLNGDSNKYAAAVYKKTVTGVSNSAWTTAFTVDSAGLGATIRATFVGTTGSVVVNTTADIIVGHYQDILIHTKNQFYTILSIKVTSNNNEDFAVELKTNHTNAVSLAVEVFPQNGETVSFVSSHSFTGATHTHVGKYGESITGGGGNSGDFHTDGNMGIKVSPNSSYPLYVGGHIAQSSGSIYSFGDIVIGQGALKKGSTTYISSSGVLANVTANANIITSGTLNADRIPTSVVKSTGSAPSNLDSAGMGVWRLNTGHTNQPSGTNYGTMVSFDNVSDTGFQIAAAYQGSYLYWRGGNSANYGGSGSMSSWQRIFADNYHPNADKWTTPRTLTVTLTGDVTGTANTSIDGSANKTITISTTGGGASTDTLADVTGRGNTTSSGLISTNKGTTADKIGDIKIARLHPTSGTAPVTSIDNLETFILSKTDGGYGAGTKPSGGDNATGIISLQTHSDNYYTQLALQTNGNNLWIRSAHASSSYGSWEKLLKQNSNISVGTITSGQITSSGSVTAGNASTSLGFYVGTTQVIQGSTRNLVNIGTITGGLTKINPSGWTAITSTHAALNIGYNGSGETRAIDILGSWSQGESKSITFTHGSSATQMVGQINVAHKPSTNTAGSSIRWGKLYHNGDSSTYTMELHSESTTLANLYINAGMVQIGHDDTYTNYGVIGFSGRGNGSNRIFAHNGTSDGMYFTAATGRGFYWRPNGSNYTGMELTSSSQLNVNTHTKIGTDGTYSSYHGIGFGGNTNGYNRVFGRVDTQDGLYLNSATGQHITFRTNGSGDNKFLMKSNGDFAMGSGNVVVLDASRNLTNINTFSKIFLHRQGSVGGLNFYSSSYKAWTMYMSPTGAGQGPTANITAPSGTLVTSWALRSFIENAGGYGWTFESGTATGNPSVVAEIRASDGAAKFGSVTTGAITGSGQLSLSGNNLAVFGPNTGWSASLAIGGNANNSTSTRASIGATNGNLHIDAAAGSFATYLNFYDGTGGVYFGGGASAQVAHVNSSGHLNLAGLGTSQSGYVLSVNGTGVLDTSRNIKHVPVIYSNAGNTAIELNNSTYTMLANPEGARCLYLGDSGDRGNYYDNDTHYFRNAGGGTVRASISGSGLAVNPINNTYNFKAYGQDTDSWFGVYDDANNSANIILTRSDGATIFRVLGHSGATTIAGTVTTENITIGSSNSYQVNGTNMLDSSGARNLRSTTASFTNAFSSWNSLNDTTNNPANSWWYGMRISHGDAMTYYSATIAINFFSDEVQLRRMSGGSSNGWRKFALQGLSSTFGALTINGSAAWGESTQGTSKGSIHLDPENATDHYGGAITFGSSDSGSGATAMAGIYTRSDGSYGTKMYLSTTDSYAVGPKTAITIDHAGIVTVNRNNLNVVGNVTAYASDERLKTNIQPIEQPLEKLMKLRGVEFDWIDGIEETHGFKPKCKHETGVIAQEVEQVIPDAISPAPFNNEYKTVEHTKIISLLIESVRSQQETIESLTKRIEELENGNHKDD